MPNAKVIELPIPDDMRLCWECMERPCLDRTDAWGLCQQCLDRYA